MARARQSVPLHTRPEDPLDLGSSCQPTAKVGPACAWLPGVAGTPRISWQRRAFSWAGSAGVCVFRAWSTLARTIWCRLKRPGGQEEGDGGLALRPGRTLQPGGLEAPLHSLGPAALGLASRDLMSLSSSSWGTALPVPHRDWQQRQGLTGRGAPGPRAYPLVLITSCHQIRRQRAFLFVCLFPALSHAKLWSPDTRCHVDAP